MNQLKRLKTQGRDFPLAHYKALKKTADKKRFREQLEIDKEAAFLEAEETNWRKSTETSNKSEGWCYLWDIARINGISYNNTTAQDLFLKTLAGDCETRPATDPKWALSGQEEYYYIKDLLTSVDCTAMLVMNHCS